MAQEACPVKDRVATAVQAGSAAVSAANSPWDAGAPGYAGSKSYAELAIPAAPGAKAMPNGPSRPLWSAQACLRLQEAIGRLLLKLSHRPELIPKAVASYRTPKRLRRGIQKLSSIARVSGAVLFLFALAVTLPPNCRAESIASKNNRGNRLFDQGKYEDAERAYLAAQADDPGRPEVLYNLGNSLIKQKKYQEGVQSLGQAVSKGDKGTKEKGWYNTGNALFSAGKYRESADAFIQALKLNPADRDAKHNLELALIKLRQQEQQTSEKSQQQQNSKNDAREKPQSRQQNAGAMQPPPGSKPQPGESARRDESITKDQAMQLLDAMQNQEKEEQRKLLERRARSKANGKDW
jgi:Ca-activated chloride channel homolog